MTDNSQSRPQSRTVAIFDFDRTITRRGTFTPFLLFSARAQPWRLLGAPLVMLHMLRYKLGMICRRRLKEHMTAPFLAGLTRAEVRAHAEAFADKLFEDGLMPGALKRIRHHAEAGDCLIMATASMDYYAEIFATRLGFDRVISTRSCWDLDDRLLAKIDGENCYGVAKLHMVRHALSEIPGDLHVTVYSDDVSDVPLFSLADEAIAIDPSPALQREAARQKFAVLNWS